MQTSAPCLVVLGGLNMDLVVRLPRLPGPGETIAGGPFIRVPGGKGANQAVAAARLGAAVAMVGRVGPDPFGRDLRRALRAEGVDTRGVRRAEAATGVALIAVDSAGQNSIAVASGANALLRPADLPASLLARADLLVTQLEVPLDTVHRALVAARAAGLRTVLNAAPARPVPPDLLAEADVVILNEPELAAMLGASAVPPGQEADAARQLRARPDQTVVVTLGSRGALALQADQLLHQPSWPVAVVDTTAAGDAFVAAYAVAERRGLSAALRFACAAGALATTRQGAQPSLPTAPEVQALLEAAPPQPRAPAPFA